MKNSNQLRLAPETIHYVKFSGNFTKPAIIFLFVMICVYEMKAQTANDIASYKLHKPVMASDHGQTTGTIELIPAYRFDQTVFLTASVKNGKEAKVLIINGAGKPVKEFDLSEIASDYIPLYAGTLSPGRYACQLIHGGKILSEVSFKVLSR